MKIIHGSKKINNNNSCSKGNSNFKMIWTCGTTLTTFGTANK